VKQVQQGLTPREREVLSTMMLGLSNQEAADKLIVSKRTVDFHLANIHSKLGVHSRGQLFRAAIRLGYYRKEVQA
jgi:DNA-binding CsgD family transcriptional regulator